MPGPVQGNTGRALYSMVPGVQQLVAQPVHNPHTACSVNDACLIAVQPQQQKPDFRLSPI